MPYDYPYRLEIEKHGWSENSSITLYSIVMTGEGAICTGPNWHEMRKLVDMANAACQVDKTKNEQPQIFEKGIAKF